MTRDDWFDILWEKLWEITHRQHSYKYKIIIIFQYKIAEDVALLVKPHENFNKNNIDHSPSQLLLYKNQ